jgi:hypothetical protein
MRGGSGRMRDTPIEGSRCAHETIIRAERIDRGTVRTSRSTAETVLANALMIHAPHSIQALAFETSAGIT